MRSAYRPALASSFGDSPRITADALRVVREPLRWCLDVASRAPPEETLPSLRAAALGPWDGDWAPPPWLLAHQVTAARRLAARLACFGGALLADAVGLGKTYVALAVATRYPRTAAGVPAAPILAVDRVLSDPQVRHRHMVVDVEHPRHGPLPTLGTPIKVDGATELPVRAAPRLGEHTGALLSELLEYPAERIAALRQEGVVT